LTHEESLYRDEFVTLYSNKFIENIENNFYTIYGAMCERLNFSAHARPQWRIHLQ